MTNGNPKNKTSVGVGASSILVIFVVLCLVTFAVLSLATARADKALSSKATLHLEEYYEAQGNAYVALEQIDKTLAWLYLENSNDYLENVNKEFSEGEGVIPNKSEGLLTLSYEVFISDTQSLVVEISVDTPKTPEDGFYTIKKWQTISKAQWQADENMPVFNGGENL